MIFADFTIELADAAPKSVFFQLNSRMIRREIVIPRLRKVFKKSEMKSFEKRQRRSVIVEKQVKYKTVKFKKCNNSFIGKLFGNIYCLAQISNLTKLSI